MINIIISTDDFEGLLQVSLCLSASLSSQDLPFRSEMENTIFFKIINTGNLQLIYVSMFPDLPRVPPKLFTVN